jgi:hypothetical protein
LCLCAWHHHHSAWTGARTFDAVVQSLLVGGIARLGGLYGARKGSVKGAQMDTLVSGLMGELIGASEDE